MQKSSLVPPMDRLPIPGLPFQNIAGLLRKVFGKKKRFDNLEKVKQY